MHRLASMGTSRKYRMIVDATYPPAQVTDILLDRNVGGGGYGQNIGAGYTADPLSMGNFVTEGLYNSEVNLYTAYGSEPVIGDFTMWGHFTQVVWKSTDSIGCYTADCTAGGLANAGGIPPFFTVCNYAPPGMFDESAFSQVFVLLLMFTSSRRQFRRVLQCQYWKLDRLGYRACRLLRGRGGLLGFVCSCSCVYKFLGGNFNTFARTSSSCV